MDRLILHCDLNNFYASVECVLNPALKDIPLAVSGNPEKRHGVILAKNELAKKAGVKTGDVIWEAMRKEPRLKCVPPHFSHYMEYSSRVFDIYTRFTDRVEPFGPDECWLDCTGSQKLFGDGVHIADTIRKTVKDQTGLTVSVGVSILILAVPFLGELVYTGWSTISLSITQVLYLVCIILAAFPVSNLLVKLCDLMNPSA